MSLPAPSVTDFSSLASLRSSARARDPEALRRTAQQFEALFTQQLLKSARAAKLGDDLLGGQQTEFYQDLSDQQMALHLASGKGLGLAEVLVKQLQGAGLASAGTSTSVIPANAAIQSPLSKRPLVSGATLDSRPALSRGQAVRANDDLDGAGNEAGDASSFIEKIRPHAERAARELGVPAEAIIAQAALETGWGRHLPQNADGGSSHNYFGIKAHRGWDGATVATTTHEHLGGRMQKVSAEFRSYDSPTAAFADYVAFLKSNPRYVEALKADDTAGFAQGLQKAGYATDPQYAAKLLSIANRARGPTPARGTVAA